LVEKTHLPEADTCVACFDDEQVGFIGLLGTFVGGLFVAPARQGQGIGRALITHALERKGELSLEVYTRNERAFRFYIGLGFREVSRRQIDDLGLPFENAHLNLKL
jgi:putative acetyltransferase